MRSYILLYFAASLLCAEAISVANAQSSPYKEDLGVDLIYQFSQKVGFQGGSSVDLHDDLGFGIMYTYRFTPRWDLQAGFDFQWIGDDAVVQADGGQSFKSSGSMHAFTPHINGIFNFFSGDLTPYVNAGLGWSWVNTDIPSSPPYRACWWDPWYGYYCGVYQNTHSSDQFIYQLGAGVRWDIGDLYTLRLGYQKRWMDFGHSSGTPDMDQIRLTIAFRY
jgi:opacity protein-like surface antigen